MNKGSKHVIIEENKVKTLYWLKKPFCQFFDPTLVSVLALRGEKAQLKLQSLLVCWNVASIVSEPYIRTREQSLNFMLAEEIFLSVLWLHADISTCPARRWALSLKLPSSLGRWSVACAISEPWTGTREQSPDFMLAEEIFLQVLWLHAHISSWPSRKEFLHRNFHLW